MTLARGTSLTRKSVRDFFKTKGFIRIFDGFFLKTKGFLPKVYEIFRSEIPLGPWHVKIRRKSTFFTHADHHLQLISEIRRITSHFIFEAAVKVSRICNLGPFSLQTNPAYFHIKHTCRLQIIVQIPAKRFK